MWLAALAAALPAQSQIAVTRVSATAADAQFQVDGQWFTGAGVFSWPAGSKHVLSTYQVQTTGPARKSRYLFAGWTSSNGPLGFASTQVVVTADPGIAWYSAQLTMQYAVSLSYYPCASEPCWAPGTVWVNGIAYQGDQDIWFNSSSTVTLEARPNGGYVFAGWQQGADLPVLYSLTLNAPLFVYPKFVPARPIVLRRGVMADL